MIKPKSLPWCTSDMSPPSILMSDKTQVGGVQLDYFWEKIKVVDNEVLLGGSGGDVEIQNF